jgi:hypothetical protein
MVRVPPIAWCGDSVPVMADYPCIDSNCSTRPATTKPVGSATSTARTATFFSGNMAMRFGYPLRD